MSRTSVLLPDCRGPATNTEGVSSSARSIRGRTHRGYTPTLQRKFRNSFAIFSHRSTVRPAARLSAGSRAVSAALRSARRAGQAGLRGDFAVESFDHSSPGSTLPEGSSHVPPRKSSTGRCSSRTLPPWSMTAPTTCCSMRSSRSLRMSFRQSAQANHFRAASPAAPYRHL